MKKEKIRIRKTSFGWFLLTFVLMSLLGLSSGAKAVLAGPRMFLSPATGSYSSNFEVILKIDTETETVKASEALLKYDKTRLGVVSVIKPSSPFFAEMGYTLDEATGELLIYNYQMDMFGKTGSGDLAVITFSVLSTGTAEVNFVCQDGVSTDSNMSGGDNSEDVIDCASVGSGSYTLTSGGGDTEATNTPIPTSTPTTAASGDTATNTPIPTTASELPETGFALPSVLVVGLGVVFLAFGLFVWF